MKGTATAVERSLLEEEACEGDFRSSVRPQLEYPLAVTTEALVLEAAPLVAERASGHAHVQPFNTGGRRRLWPIGALTGGRAVVTLDAHRDCRERPLLVPHPLPPIGPVEKWRLQLDVRTEACGTAGWERRPVDGIAVRVDADEARVAFPPDEFGRWQRDRHGRWWHFHSD